MPDIKLKIPSVLAFEAKLVPSDALMYAGNWEGDTFQPIIVGEKAVRGTISNRLKTATANDPVKLDAEVSKANLQTVDIAALPHNTNTLKVAFSLRVLSNLHIPSTCNDPAYQSALSDKITQYIQSEKFTELSKRYAYNIANGRFLWRNRVGAEAVRVVVTTREKTFEFNCYDFNLRDFPEDEKVIELAQIIQQGLAESHAFLKIEAYTQLGEGQAVYPSQELVMGGDQARLLYHNSIS